MIENIYSFRYLKQVLSFLALIMLVFSCQKEEVRLDIEGLDLGIEEAKNVEITYSDSANIKVSIEGPVMLNYVDRQQPKQEFTDGVKVTFFDENQNISSVLTAKYGLRIENRLEVIVRDSVVWQSVDQRRLETEELIWDERKKKVFTNRFVAVMLPPGDTTFHMGFEADQDFSNVKFKSTSGNKVVEDLSKGL